MLNNFRSMTRESLKDFNFSRDEISSKGSYGHVGSSFDYPAAIFFRETGEKFSLTSLVIKKNFALKMFPSICSPGHADCSFNSPPEGNSNKLQKESIQFENDWEGTILKKQKFPDNVRMDL